MLNDTRGIAEVVRPIFEKKGATMGDGIADKRRRMLMHGARNLAALKRTVVKPSVSNAGKEVMAAMIIKQTALNERLLRALVFHERERM